MRILGVCGSLQKSSGNRRMLQVASAAVRVVGGKPIVRGPSFESDVGLLLTELIERVRLESGSEA